eukprot:g10097.t1
MLGLPDPLCGPRTRGLDGSRKQSRNFRKQQIVGSQADLFRADVEQAIGASSAVQDRLIVVSALLNGWTLPEATRDFLEDIFYLCISNAFLYFLVSLIASISANILARKCQKDRGRRTLFAFWGKRHARELLCNCVRPPFAEMMRDVDLAAELETAEAFEKQGVSQVLRIPGADQLTGQKLGVEQLWQKVDSESTALMDRLIQQQISNELTLMEMQHDWDELQTYTPYFLVWGLRSLLNSFGFYALAHTYRAQKPYGFQVHTFYVVVVIGLSFISERLMATSFRDRLDLESRHRESSAFGGWIWAAYAAQLVTVAIAHFRFGWNAGKSQPTRGGSITEELLRERSGLQRQDSTMSDEWSMAPEVVSTFQSGHVEDISNENVLNERWRRLSFVRVYMRKFCLFGGWAVIFVWGVVTLYQMPARNRAGVIAGERAAVSSSSHMLGTSWSPNR